jgi:hypothetical protein
MSYLIVHLSKESFINRVYDWGKAFIDRRVVVRF